MDEMREPTGAERAISVLKEAVRDLLPENQLFADDLYLLRWLKARDMDVKAAERMLRESNHWRNTRVKEVMQATVDPELAKLFCKHVRKSHSKSGALIEFVDAGLLDVGEICKKFGKAQLDKYVVEEILALEALNIAWNRKVFEESGSNVITEDTIRGGISVYDDTNVTLKQISSLKTLQYVRQTAKDVKNYIPSLLSTLVVVNCPTFGVFLVNLVKPMLESKHLKIECYNSNKEVWSEALLQHVHPDKLPTEYGGSMDVSKENRRRYADLLSF